MNMKNKSEWIIEESFVAYFSGMSCYLPGGTDIPWEVFG